MSGNLILEQLFWGSCKTQAAEDMHIQHDLGACIPLVLTQYHPCTALKCSVQNRKTRNLKTFGVVKKLEGKKKLSDHVC